jgi:hypothetical protein
MMPRSNGQSDRDVQPRATQPSSEVCRSPIFCLVEKCCTNLFDECSLATQEIEHCEFIRKQAWRKLPAKDAAEVSSYAVCTGMMSLNIRDLQCTIPIPNMLRASFSFSSSPHISDACNTCETNTQTRTKCSHRFLKIV